MLQSFFTSMAGMLNFTKGLDNVSNNISNMNTPGFRGTDLFYRSVSGGEDGVGLGSSVEGDTLREKTGDIRQTGNPTDVAIVGEGYFVLQDQYGDLFFTRSGQFVFDEDGILVESVSGMNVLSLQDSGTLEEINISEKRIIPPEKTSTISFRGNLAESEADTKIDDVKIFGENGGEVPLSFSFVNNNDSTWNVDILDSNGSVLATTSIAFDATGAPISSGEHDNIAIEIDGNSWDLNLDFGEQGSYTGTTQFDGGESNISANVEDGGRAVGLLSVTFDENGQLEFEYINGVEEKGDKLALAYVKNENSVRNYDGSLFVTEVREDFELGHANQGVYGRVNPQSIELSNIELSQEFADLLILQRGYQASARVLSVSNELIEQLYNNKG